MNIYFDINFTLEKGIKYLSLIEFVFSPFFLALGYFLNYLHLCSTSWGGCGIRFIFVSFLFAPLSLLGLTTYILYSVSKKKGIESQKNNMYKTLLFINIIISLIFSAWLLFSRFVVF